MDNRIYGYARVSSREQNEDMQIESLSRFGVPQGNIIIDKCSGNEVLGSIAENERNKIRSRQREGIEAAKKKNVRFGRPAKPLPDNWREIIAEVKSGNKKPAEAIPELEISRSCCYRLYKSF